MPVIPVQTRLAPPATQASPPVQTSSPAGLSRASSAPAPSTLPRLATPPPSAHSSAPLDLHIDSLVLHGFSAADGRRAGAAFEQELARLLAGSESPISEYTAGAAALADSAPASAALSAELVPGRPELTGLRAARALHARLRA